jgi:hypothetical protein
MVGSMTASVRRRTSFSRALLALAGVALLALVVLAALLLDRAVTEPARTPGTEAHHAVITAVGEPGHTAPAVHALRQQPSTRARSAVFAVLASAVAVGAWTFSRLRFARAGRPRTLRVTGLPSGRAPPTLRIA